jgi:hypothetical protein
MKLHDLVRRTHAACTALCLTATLCGCGDDPVIIPGEHVTIVSEVPDAEVCPGTVRYLDDAYRAIADYMSLDAEARRMVRYHYTDNVPCPSSNTGCAYGNGTDTWATTLDLTHELVHAISFQKYGVNSTSVLFFEQGLAVALGQPTGAGLGWDLTRVETDVLATEGTEIDQQVAGYVAAYLLTTSGFPKFESVLTSLARGATRDEIDAALVSAYGTDLLSLVEDQLPGAPYFVDRNRLGLPECLAEPAPWIDGHFAVQAAFECTDERVRGDLAHDKPRLSVPFAVDAPGTYVEARRGPAGFRLDSCAPQSSVPPSGFAPAPGETLIFRGLDEGKHFVTLEGERGGSAEYDLSAMAPIPVAACLDDVPAGAIVVGASVNFIAIAGAPSGGMPEAHFLLQQPARARYAWEGITNFELCRGTCDAQQCEVLSNRAGFEIDLEPGYYVMRAERTTTSRAGGSLTLTAR